MDSDFFKPCRIHLSSIRDLVFYNLKFAVDLLYLQVTMHALLGVEKDYSVIRRSYNMLNAIGNNTDYSLDPLYV